MSILNLFCIKTLYLGSTHFLKLNRNVKLLPPRAHADQQSLEPGAPLYSIVSHVLWILKISNL